MSIFMGISIFLSFVVGIAILVYYFSNLREINAFIPYGAFMAIMYLIVNLLSFNIGVPLILAVITYIKVAIYTATGMHICSSLGFKDLPLIRRIIKKEDYEEINIKNYILTIFAAVLGAVIYSYVLFKLTSPAISDALKNILGREGNINRSGELTFTLVFTMISIGISEELSFRFVIQNYLAKKITYIRNRYWIAIVFSALFWTLAHGGTTNPEWVKLVQIFPVGLSLGWMYKKFGLESCIIAHASFNILMTLIPVI